MEIAISTNLEITKRMPTRLAAIAVCLLAGLGMVAVVRIVSPSYARVPDAVAATRRGAAPSLPERMLGGKPQALAADAQTTINSRYRGWCTGCGVIQSIHPIKSATGGETYVMTVRLRDGSTTVFNEATPRNWPSGERVIVIAGRTPLDN